MAMKEAKLKLYYLFMLADGEITAKEEEQLAVIRDEMGITTGDIKKIVRSYEHLKVIPRGDYADLIITEADKILVGEEKTWWDPINHNKRKQAQVIWTLIDLGHADGDYSVPEQKVVAHFVDKWDFDKNTLAAMLDIAQEMLQLRQTGAATDAAIQQLRAKAETLIPPKAQK